MFLINVVLLFACVTSALIATENHNHTETECDQLKESNETWICVRKSKCLFLKQIPSTKLLKFCGSSRSPRKVCCPQSKIEKSFRKRTAAVCDKFKNESTIWSCKDDSQCPHLSELISNNFIVRCSSEDSLPKLCCPELRSGISDISNSSSGHSSSTELFVDLKGVVDPESVVTDKCYEYAKYRYVNETYEPIIIGQKPYNKSRLVCIQNEPLVTGSNRAVEMELPHMAALGYGKNNKSIIWSCSGTLISEKFILSAARCSERPGIGKVRWAALGLIQLDKAISEQNNKNLFQIKRYINHPQYKPPLQNNDIALFEIDKPITFSPSIRPVCLLTTSQIPKTVGDLVGIAGWGTYETDNPTQVLLKADIGLRKGDVCKVKYEGAEGLNGGFNEQTMLCAGEDEDSVETCEGDSGGPLQIELTGYPCMWLQVGLTSLTSKNCTPPIIFTKIPSYVSWIQKIVWQ